MASPPFPGEEHVMFNTIVVGVDGREGGRDALALGERLRAIFGGDLIAVNAYPYDLFASRGASPDFESIMHANANDMVAAGVGAHGRQGTGGGHADGSPATRTAQGGQVARRQRHRRWFGPTRSDRSCPGRRRHARHPAWRPVPGRRGPAPLCRARQEPRDDRRRLRRIAGGPRGRPPRTRPGSRDRRAAARDRRSSSRSRPVAAG